MTTDLSSRAAHSGRNPIAAALFFGVLVTAPAAAQDWWKGDDTAFAKQYGKQALGDSLTDQSTVAWMLFARANQPQAFQGTTFTVWELLPSNDDTFSAAVPAFKAENKVRTRPHLQRTKAEIVNPQLKGVHGPQFGGEEVTRNLVSYTYIRKNQLYTQAGVKTKLTSPDPKVDMPVGAVEYKGRWFQGALNGAYQVTDTSQTPPVTYSLVGLHVMAKMAQLPADPFYSESPSWFWTTFEFKDNPGLANAQSLITYKDAISAADSLKLLTQAGLGSGPFVNYRCNGTQIRFSDAKNPAIILGNTTMENFAFSPPNTPPSKWTKWNVSCHTCHGTSSANPAGTGDNFYFPFSIQYYGPLAPGTMNGYQSLDFNWSIAFNAQ